MASMSVLDTGVDTEGRYTCARCGAKSPVVRRTRADGVRELRFPSGTEPFFCGWRGGGSTSNPLCIACTVDKEEWVTREEATRRFARNSRSVPLAEQIEEHEKKLVELRERKAMGHDY